MNKVKCFVIDDEQHAIDLLTEYISITPGLELIGTDTDPENACRLITEKEVVLNVCFMDINMEGMHGLELARKIKKFTEIVFVTGYPEYAPDAFQLRAVDYLVKPITYDRFAQAISGLYLHLSPLVVNNMGKDYFFIKTAKGSLQKIYTDRILYVESAGNYVQICMANKKYLAYLTMKETEEKLNKNFIRVHRSCIVNIDKVETVDNNTVVLESGDNFSLSDNYKEQFFAAIAPHLLSSNRGR